MAEVNPQFSARLRFAIEQAGFTRRGLAEVLGIREQSITKYSKHGGVPEWHILVPMARLLKVSVDWLLTGEEEGQAQAVECPPPGYDLIRLPRVDPRMLSPGEADNLEKALVVLRGEGEARQFASALQTNIETMHKAALATPSQAYELSEPGKGKKRA